MDNPLFPIRHYSSDSPGSNVYTVIFLHASESKYIVSECKCV